MSQLLTLYTTPVIYLAFDRLARRVSGRRRGRSRRSARAGTAVNLSAPFINRPVATTLLTLGFALAGAAAFRLLPVAPLPQVDFPTISVTASLPGASPGDDGHRGGYAARAPARTHRRRHGNDFDEHDRLDLDHHAVRLESQHRRRRARRAGRDQCRAQPAAGQFAEQSELPQSQSGRCTDSDSRAHVRHDAQRQDVRRGVHGIAAEAFAAARRRAGIRRRQLAAGGAHRLESDRAQQVRHRPRRRAHHARELQRQSTEGPSVRRRQELGHLRKRSAVHRRAISPADRRLSQRGAGASRPMWAKCRIR